MVKLYKPKEIFWIVRLNLVIFTDIKVAEITAGLLGFGILIQFPLHRSRM